MAASAYARTSRRRLLRRPGAGGVARAAGRLLTVTATAVLTALVAQRINPPCAEPTTATPVEAVLARRVAAVDLDLSSLEGAARSLGDAAGVTVTIEVAFAGRPAMNVSRARGGAGERPVARLRNVTVARALAAIVDRFGDHSGPPLSYFVDGQTIRIGDVATVERLEPMVVRAYDVSDFEDEERPGRAGGGIFVNGADDDGAPNPNLVRVELGTELAGRLIETEIFPTVWGAGNGPRYGMQVWAGRLIISAPASSHRAIERLLFLFRHAAPPADLIAKGPP